MSGNAVTGIQFSRPVQKSVRNPVNRAISRSSAAKATGPGSKNLWATDSTEACRAAARGSRRRSMRACFYRAVKRLGRIAGHAEREHYYNVCLGHHFSTGWTPSLLFWFRRQAGFSRGLVKGGEVPAPRSCRLLCNVSSRIGSSCRNSISDIGKLYFKHAAEMSDAPLCEGKSVHLPRNQNGGTRGGRIEALKDQLCRAGREPSAGFFGYGRRRR